MTNILVCTICPIACKISVSEQCQENYEVTGNKCEKGKSFALQEIKNPLRIFTTTINIKGGNIKRLPVRSKEPVPKNIITELTKPIREVQINAPVKRGDIIIENILDSGVDIVASRSVNADDKLLG